MSPRPAARAGITLLRGAGLRLGELLDLELDCLWDLPGHGTWLKVPLGKLATERVIPLDDATLAALDGWMAARGRQRDLPHPATDGPRRSCSPCAAPASAPAASVAVSTPRSTPPG